MLFSTFQHIEGIGEKRRETSGTGDASHGMTLYHTITACRRENTQRSETPLLNVWNACLFLDHGFFRESLGRKLSWRAYNTFRDHACFLDIETTGLSPYSSDVTTVCVHSRTGTKSYVAGNNLDVLQDDLQEYKYIVTFNGARFDLPFLAHNMGIGFPQIHLDLLYPLRSLGYSGGLKNIEKTLGMTRDTEGVTGYDAVRLWYAYKNGRTVEVAGRRIKGSDALDLLVEYNREDTVNLERLADYTVGELKKRTLPAP